MTGAVTAETAGEWESAEHNPGKILFSGKKEGTRANAKSSAV